MAIINFNRVAFLYKNGMTYSEFCKATSYEFSGTLLNAKYATAMWLSLTESEFNQLDADNDYQEWVDKKKERFCKIIKLIKILGESFKLPESDNDLELLDDDVKEILKGCWNWCIFPSENYVKKMEKSTHRLYDWESNGYINFSKTKK